MAFTNFQSVDWSNVANTRPRNWQGLGTRKVLPPWLVLHRGFRGVVVSAAHVHVIFACPLPQLACKRADGEVVVIGVQDVDVGHVSRTFHRDEAMVEANLFGLFVDHGTAIDVDQVDAEVRDVAFAVGHRFIVGAVDAEQGLVVAQIQEIGGLKCTGNVEHTIHRTAVTRVS